MKTTLGETIKALGIAEATYSEVLRRIASDALQSHRRFLGTDSSYDRGTVDEFELNLGNQATQLARFAGQVHTLRERVRSMQFEIAADAVDQERCLIIREINKHRQACGHEPKTYAAESTPDLKRLMTRVMRKAEYGQDYFANEKK